MTETLQKANLLQAEINEAEKHLKLIGQIIDGFAKAGTKPKLGMQVNPTLPGNFMPFDPKYHTISIEDTIDAYVAGVKHYKQVREQELANLLK